MEEKTNPKFLDVFCRTKLLLSSHQLLIAMTALLAFVLLVRQTATLFLEDTPYIFNESFRNWLITMKLYANPTFEAVRSLEWPLFNWWIPIISGSLGVDVSLSAIVFLNTLVATLLFLTGVILIFRNSINMTLGIAWSIGLILAATPQQLFDNLYPNWGDFYLSGYIVFCEGLLRLCERGHWNNRKLGVATAFVLAFGLYTKPIYLLWLLVRLSLSAFSFFYPHKATIKHKRFLVFFAALGVWATLFFPSAMYRQAYLSIISSKDWRFFGAHEYIFWFFKNVWLWISTANPGVWILAALILFSITSSIKGGISFDRRRILAILAENPGPAAIAICITLLSFFVTSDGLLSTQFLLILTFVFFVQICSSKVTSLAWRRVTIVALGICVVGVIQNNQRFRTFEQLGYDRVLEVLIDDLSSTPANGRLISVFIVNYSHDYNRTAFDAYRHSTCSLADRTPTTTCLSPWDIVARSSRRYGDWGHDGGFPLSFFKNGYVLINLQDALSLKTHEAYIYNRMIHERLAENDPHFLDGLIELGRFENQIGETWAIFKRTRPPSLSSFKAIITEALELDPDNPWNEPYRIALKRIDDSKFNPASAAEYKRRANIRRFAIARQLDQQRFPFHLGVLNGNLDDLDQARYPDLLTETVKRYANSK